jgi:hypothetical protein
MCVLSLTGSDSGLWLLAGLVALEGTDGAVASLATGTTGIVTVTNYCGPVLATGNSCGVAIYAPFTTTLGTTQVQIAGDNTNVLTLPTTVS